VAVDPSSSLSHGALLGDRIRMCDHGLDPGVFVRSMSSRGSLGGVARATVDAVAILDAGGWDVVVVETVGVGQAEVEIVQIAHTTVVVSVPGLGDDIQALKAGLLEIADLHVVNKLDRPDANRTIAELLAMLALTDPARGMEWAVPVLGTNALNGDGVPELADSLAGHREWLRTSGELAHRERVMAAARVRAVAKDLTIERIDHAIDVEINELLDAVVARRMDPHAAAASLIDRVSVTS
jgi:LAO/AO transport system kinase